MQAVIPIEDRTMEELRRTLIKYQSRAICTNPLDNEVLLLQNSLEAYINNQFCYRDKMCAIRTPTKCGFCNKFKHSFRNCRIRKNTAYCNTCKD